MKKLFAIFLALILVCNSFHVISAQENLRSADEIRAEILRYHKEINEVKENYPVQYLRSAPSVYNNFISIENWIQKDTILPLKEKIADLEVELSKVEGRVIDLNTPTFERSVYNSISWYNLEVWDILVFKPKPGAMLKFAIFGQWWQHAALVVEWNKIIEAVNFWKISRYRSLNDVFSLQERQKYYEIAVVRIPNMSAEDKKKISEYAQKKLLNKPYPINALIIPLVKYSTDFFYCSSLVWRAYKSWAKYIDLDSDYNWNWEHDIVWPADLLYNSFTMKYSINLQ